MEEFKRALKAVTTLGKVNDIMQIVADSLNGLTAEEFEELSNIATERKQAIYNSRYLRV